jgi:hypothetical protein
MRPRSVFVFDATRDLNVLERARDKVDAGCPGRGCVSAEDAMKSLLDSEDCLT